MSQRPDIGAEPHVWATSSWGAIVYAVGQPGTGPVGAAGPEGSPGPSNAYLATNATLALDTSVRPVVSLNLGAGHYVLTATTNIASAGNGVLQCSFADGAGQLVTPGSLWTRTVIAGPNTYSNVDATYALTLTGSGAQQVSLACSSPTAAAVTQGTAAITAIKVGSLN